VQMVASEPEWQLERYSAMMNNAGFTELTFRPLANSPGGRVWRSVSNRKRYATAPTMRTLPRIDDAFIVKIRSRSNAAG
jgi:hypothetical protein